MATRMEMVSSRGLSHIAAPLHVSGEEASGDITLHTPAPRFLHLVDADTGGTFPMSIPGASAAPPLLVSWDTIKFSQSALRKSDPRNYFISKSRRDPLQPCATDLGLCLFSRGTGKMHCTRIHDLDFRWWLSGRTTPQRKSGAENVEFNGRGAGVGSQVNTVLCRFHNIQADAIEAVQAPSNSEQLWAQVNSIRRTHLKVNPITKGRGHAAADEAATTGTAQGADTGSSTSQPSILKKAKRKRVVCEGNLSDGKEANVGTGESSGAATKFVPQTTVASMITLLLTDGMSYQNQRVVFVVQRRISLTLI